MAQQVPLSTDAISDTTHHGSDGTHQVMRDLAYQRLAIVNVVYCGLPGKSAWVLIDAGVAGTAALITKAASARFGANAKPQAIVLTHAHFDHVGALTTLAEQWDVPIYAHERELPYLNGSAAYPPPDPSVGGGLMSMLSRFYPRGPIDVSRWLRPLPQDGTVPPMPGWRWLAAPGHSPGQVALWQESDRVLIAADAFITTAQESAYAVALQKTEMHGPPMYYTQDWRAAKDTVERLAALEPEVAVVGHGHAMHGQLLRDALHELATQFDSVAVPRNGEYVKHPARAEDGSAYRAP